MRGSAGREGSAVCPASFNNVRGVVLEMSEAYTLPCI